MKAEYDERVGESQKLQNGGYIVKPISDEGIKDDATSNVNRRPFLPSAFNLNKSKKVMQHLIKVLDGLETNGV